MDTLVKLSFYCFAAASFSLIAAAVMYIIFAVGRVRVLRHTLETSTGHTVTSSRMEQEPGPIGFARWGTMLTAFGAFFAVLSFVLRWGASKHFPLTNMYEFSLLFVCFLSILTLIFERQYRVLQLGAITSSVTALMTLYIWSLPVGMREVNPLIPALQNNGILTAHVSAAVLSYATFTVAFGAAVLFLIAERFSVSWLPSPEMLDDIAFRAITVGFPLFTLNLILGSVWAHEAWGTYWQWDPKETAALFTWLVYGVYLHTRTLRGWRGRRSAYVLLFGFGATIFTYYGNYFFGGLHAYGGV
ncbi:MAG TPA: c-type cytochrome biogenesis protein CcsB [Thermomicrobiales bacterium]|nr:c-type cytochrome biogenesis protein CcsB [Thermomicrobiales bacterium]